jgi:stearoyl-CoA desaturase (delta-9 desaturase)
MSITSGYHRLWAHRTYQAHWSVRLVYILFGTMALQHSVLVWASQHRTHHRHVDDVDRDPYSAKRGFWFSHIGWILRNYPSGVNDFTNAKDLERDPMVMFQHRWYVPLAVGLNFGGPLAFGFAFGNPIGALLLGGVLRLVVNHHLTFFINSLAHMWGSQPYTDENSARDNGALALITYGEGYHNFHHIFQNDYRNGVRWWQYDPSKWLISSLAWVGAVQGHRAGARAQAGARRALRADQGARHRGGPLRSAGRSRNGRACVTNGSAIASAGCSRSGRRPASARGCARSSTDSACSDGVCES